MARSIDEIKAEIATAFISQEVVRSAYGLDNNATFDKAFSPISIESVLFYIVASCIWVLECLFDRHTAEVGTRIEALRPHTLRWYVSKTLEYMHNGKFVLTDGVVAADYYDVSGLTETEIEKKRIVKYAVATESNTQVFIKVAKSSANGRPTQLTPNELSGLEYYLSQIKDAGVAIKVLNEPADKMNVELVVLYDPSVLNAEYLTPDDADEEIRELKITSIDNDAEVITAAVQEVIAAVQRRVSQLRSYGGCSGGQGCGGRRYCRRRGLRQRQRELHACHRLSPPVQRLLRVEPNHDQRTRI